MLSYPPFGLWMLAPAAPALLVAAVRGRGVRTAFAAGTTFGAVFVTRLLTWLDNLGALAWLALAAVQAPGTGVLGVTVCVLSRRRTWPLTVACMWVAFEALRDRFPLGGFPWGRLAFSQARSPLASWAAFGGTPLVTFALAALGTALTCTRRVTAASALAGSVMLAAAGPLIPRPQPAVASATVAVVQGNVPPGGATLEEQVRAAGVTRNHAALTRWLAAEVRAGRQPAPDVEI